MPGPTQTSAPSSQTTTRRRFGAHDIALIAVFAGLIAALGVAPPLYVFGSAVPVTLQTLGVMLAGSVLGAKRGAAAALVLLALVALGLPLLSGGRGGLGVFAGPSAGYALGFPVGAFVVGWLTERLHGRHWLLSGLLANLVGGIAVVYAIGVPVQAWRIGAPTIVGVLIASVIYLPGDLAKAVVATLVTRGVRRAGIRLPSQR